MKPTDAELAKASWMRLPKFYRNNSFMLKVVNEIIHHGFDSTLVASTSHQLLNISENRDHPSLTLRVDNSDSMITVDWFEKDHLKESNQYLSEEDAFIAIKRDVNLIMNRSQNKAIEATK